MKFILKKRAEI